MSGTYDSDITELPLTTLEELQLTSVVMGLFTGPHQTSFSEDGSFTTRLSEGERPVFAPE